MMVLEPIPATFGGSEHTWINYQLIAGPHLSIWGLLAHKHILWVNTLHHTQSMIKWWQYHPVGHFTVSFSNIYWGKNNVQNIVCQLMLQFVNRQRPTGWPFDYVLSVNCVMGSLTLLRWGIQVLQQITPKHLLFVCSFSANPSHLSPVCFSTSHPDKSGGLRVCVAGTQIDTEMIQRYCAFQRFHHYAAAAAASASFTSEHVVGCR